MPAVTSARRRDRDHLVRRLVVRLLRIVDVGAARVRQPRVGTPRQPAEIARCTELSRELRLLPVLEQDVGAPARTLERDQRIVEAAGHPVEPYGQASGVVTDAAAML